MKHRLKVVEDNTRVKTLVFRSYADAKRFLDFVHVYMDETGCGNGYSAYWPNRIYIPGSRFLPFTEGITVGSRPLPYPFAINKKENVIRPDIFRRMLYCVVAVRFVGEKNIASKVIEYLHGVDYTTRGIRFTFDVNDLPPCQRPAVGDMYRIPRSRLGNDPNVLKYSEGRVVGVSECGGKLRVVSCFDFDEFHKAAEIFEIDAAQAIKINDWLKARWR